MGSTIGRSKSEMKEGNTTSGLKERKVIEYIHEERRRRE
jgi:hypothetical protein